MNDDVKAESLLPYDRWTEDALREVVLRALEHAAEHGLPGEHHFYITFNTDAPGVSIPRHLKARYPQEMTIVLQHRFWDLKVDRVAAQFQIGLSFGGVPSTLVVPFAALTAFADPHVRYGLRFQGGAEGDAESVMPPAAEPAAAEPVAEPAAPLPQAVGEVVRLDAFRRRPTRD